MEKMLSKYYVLPSHEVLLSQVKYAVWSTFLRLCTHFS